MNASQQKTGGSGWLIIAICAVGVALAIFYGAGFMADARESALAPPEETLPLVEIVEARTVDGMSVVEEGFLRPRAEIDVVSEVSGKVIEVAASLQPGGRFAKGDVLFRIDARTYEADLARAQADVAAARADLERFEADAARQNRLADIGATAESQRQAADAALASARSRIGQTAAALTLAEKRMEDTVVRAPFDATVISKQVALGGFLQPGIAAAKIFDRSAGEIVLSLRPKDAASVSLAAQTSTELLEVSVRPSRASAGTATLSGFVKSFGQSVDARSRTVPVVIEVPTAFSNSEASVFANDFVEVTMPAVADGQIYAVPVGTIRAESYLWILADGNTLERVSVTPVQTTATEVLFTSSRPLEGERLVLTAITEEANGIRVDIYDAEARRETLQ